MASSSFYSGSSQGATNVNAVEDSKNAAALSEAAAAASAAASANSAASVSAFATTATTKASESAASATASSTSAAASQASRVASEAAKAAAETAKTAAETARDAASVSEVASGAAEVAAETAETNAAASAAAALSSQNAAATSATTASTKAAESATSAAASEASNVASGVAKVAAETAEANAETAQTASETAKTASEVAKVAAETAETNASTSAATATTQAGIATTKAGEASTSATAAEASKVAAAASQVAASNSQVAAATSASSAAAIFDQFDDTYLGSKSVEPTVDNDGNSLVTGALFYNSATGGMFIWDGAEWIAASAAGGASLTNFAFTASAGQTTFSGTDDNSNTLVYTQDNLILILNGVILEAGTDYTATDGTTIVLTDATVVNDELNVVAFKTFTTADMVSSSNGGTFYGNVDFSAGIDVTGNITVTGTVDGRDVAADGAIIDSLGTAATTASTAYATAAQGTLAASATQPGDLATVATSGAYSDLSGTPSPFDPNTLATVATTGAYSDLSGTPTLGTAASTASSAYATAAQGTLADSATQPGDLATVATSGAYGDLSGTPTLGTAANTASTDYATAAQGTTADAALPKAGGAMSGPIATNSTFDGRDVSVDGAKLDGIQSGATNTVTNATHTGEVTGSGFLTIADNVVDEANLKVSNAPTNGYFLSAQSSNTGGMTWAAVAGGVPSGTKMVFQQTSAPTGWTKDTTHNNKALRVVSGSAGSGGSVNFSTAFANKTTSGSIGNTSAGGTVAGHTLTTAQTPSHNHYLNGNGNMSGGFSYGRIVSTGGVAYYTSYTTNSSGGNGSHSHGFTGASHNHSFSGSAIDLRVQYVDLIIASKD